MHDGGSSCHLPVHSEIRTKPRWMTSLCTLHQPIPIIKNRSPLKGKHIGCWILVLATTWIRISWILMESFSIMFSGPLVSLQSFRTPKWSSPRLLVYEELPCINITSYWSCLIYPEAGIYENTGSWQIVHHNTCSAALGICWNDFVHWGYSLGIKVIPTVSLWTLNLGSEGAQKRRNGHILSPSMQCLSCCNSHNGVAWAIGIFVIESFHFYASGCGLKFLKCEKKTERYAGPVSRMMSFQSILLVSKTIQSLSSRSQPTTDM